MKILRTKLKREIRNDRVRFVAVTLVVALGIMVFAGTWLAYRGLDTSFKRSDAVLKYNDFLINVDRAPTDLLPGLEQVNGVLAVTGRNAVETGSTMPGGEEIRTRIIGVPDDGQPAVNALYMNEGDWISGERSSPGLMSTPGGPGSVAGLTAAAMVEKHLADYYRISVGDTVTIETPSGTVGARIDGIVSSPEYNIVTTSTADLLATPQNFGVLYLSDDLLGALFGTVGHCNEFCFLMKPGHRTEKAINAAMKTATALLESDSRVLSTRAGADQAGKLLIDLHFQGIRQISAYFPACFLLVAAISLFMIITRMTYAQRRYIGAMMAAGVRTGQIARHFLSYSLLTGLVGSVVGMVGGFIFGLIFTHLYAGSLGIPLVVNSIDWPFLALGFAVSMATCLAAASFPVWRLSRMTPAEVMSGEEYHKGTSRSHTSLFERLFPFTRRLSLLSLIPLRNLGRSRRRSLFTIAGLALSLALMIISFSFIDSLDSSIDYQFHEYLGYDAEAIWANPLNTTTEDVDALAGTDGVGTAEPRTQMPCRFLKDGDTIGQGTVEALSQDGRLIKLTDLDGNPVSLPTDGALAGKWFEQGFGVKVGDEITVDTEFGRVTVPVRGFVRQYSGVSLFVNYEYAQRMIGSKLKTIGLDYIPVSSALVKASGDVQGAKIRERLLKDASITSVVIPKYTEDEIHRSYLSVITLLLYTVLAFAIAMGTVVIYNTVSIAFLERRREISTMLAIGTKVDSITTSMTIENLALSLLSLPPGLLLGYFVAKSMIADWCSEFAIWQMTVRGLSWSLGIAFIILVTLLAQLPDRHRTARMDIVSAIRERTG